MKYNKWRTNAIIQLGDAMTEHLHASTGKQIRLTSLAKCAG
jgi:hypothetical protein